MTNIAMMTTWLSVCGISEYSKNLAKEFYKMGHKLMLFTNNVDGINPKVWVEPVFGVACWGENPVIRINAFKEWWKTFEKENGPIDIMYIQYHNSLYEPKGFNEILKWIPCPIIITFHDGAINSKHIFPKNVTSIVHNENIKHEYFIPFPTIEKTPKVFSFGMGRNSYDFIAEACKEIGITFEGHDAKKDGWLSEEELFNKMRLTDAIVLWYNDINLDGQSAALRTAISSHRPVIVNDIGWFSNAPYFVHKCGFDNNPKLDSLYLRVMLESVLHLDYIKQNSFNSCAKKYLEIYEEIKNGR
jgi:hypothetical protein